MRVLKWFVDVSFGVHPDFKSHTGSVLTVGNGAIQSQSMKQKVNSRSTCEAELIGADDALTQILWTKLFLEDLGYKEHPISGQSECDSSGSKWTKEYWKEKQTSID